MTKQTRRINVEQASIKTASVEIKVVTINGKQMTLSVFRQLENEDIIDPETLQLKGIPWGRVNYWWGDERGECHIIWQKNGKLRRGALNTKQHFKYDDEFWSFYKCPFVYDDFDEILFVENGWKTEPKGFTEYFLSPSIYRKNLAFIQNIEKNEFIMHKELFLKRYQEAIIEAKKLYEEWHRKYNFIVYSLCEIDQIFIAI